MLCSHPPTNTPFSVAVPLSSWVESYTPFGNIIHNWHHSPSHLRSAPLQRPTTPTPRHSHPEGPWRRPHQMFPRHSTTIFARGTNSRSVIQGIPHQGIPRFDQLWKNFAVLLAQPYGLRPKYRPVPPFYSALSPNSPVEWCAPAYAGHKCYVTPSPPPGPIASFPCTSQSPIRAPSSHFAAVPLWGPGPVDRRDGAACLVDLPPPEDGRRYGCTLFYGGDTQGKNHTSHEVGTRSCSLISTGSSGSARHTATVFGAN